MYLVTVLKTLDNKYLPKFEKLVAFEFELVSDEWTSVHFVPEKGAGFEMHFGNSEHSTIVNKNGEIEGLNCFAAITSKDEIALSLIHQSLRGCSYLAIVDDDFKFITVLHESKEMSLSICR